MSDLKDTFGLTYVLISHDLTVVRHMADRIGVLYLGRLVEEATPDDLFHTPQHPYTRMLLEAAPKMDGFGREVPPPQGEIPDPINPPPGCAFNPRCPLATDICRTERPVMRDVGMIIPKSGYTESTNSTHLHAIGVVGSKQWFREHESRLETLDDGIGNDARRVTCASGTPGRDESVR